MRIPIILMIFLLLSACTTIKPVQNGEFPVIDLTDINGKQLIVNGVINKPTILLLFDYNCPYCVKAIDAIEANILNKISDSDAQIIAVGREHDIEYLVSLREKHGLKINLVADPKRDIFSIYAKKSVPRIYLYDSTGSLIFEHTGWSDKSWRRIYYEIQVLLGNASVVT